MNNFYRKAMPDCRIPYLFTLILLVGSSSLFAQGTCLSCKGSGEVTVRNRVPVRKETTYSYLGEITKTYTNVVYDTRRSRVVCYGCNGTGHRNITTVPTVKKPAPPPPPPPTLRDNIDRRFGSLAILSSVTVGKERLRVISYKPKGTVTVNALIRVRPDNTFETILDNYYSMYLFRDEYDRFSALALKDNGTKKYALADLNGNIIYTSDHEFDLINARGDIWQGTEVTQEVDGKRKQQFKLINYKTGAQLNPQVSLSDYCACKQLWTQEGIIDVRLPHAVTEDQISVGLMDKNGEILVPPIYKSVLNCDPRKGRVRFVDEEGYVFDFDYLGRLLTPPGAVTIKDCEDGSQLIRSKVNSLVDKRQATKENEVQLTDRVVIHHPENPALNGLVFSEAGCPDDRGWAKVTTARGNEPMMLHKTGEISSIQDQVLATSKINTLKEVNFQPADRWVKDPWFILRKKNGKSGGALAYFNADEELVYRDIAPEYRQMVCRWQGSVMVQNDAGLWGIIAGEETLKPKYTELYQMTKRSWLAVTGSKFVEIELPRSRSPKFNVTKAGKMHERRAANLSDYLNYYRKVGHLDEGMCSRLINYDLNIDAPLIAEELTIDQPVESQIVAFWFRQNGKDHFIVRDNESDYHHYERAAGTKPLKYGTFFSEGYKGGGYLYLPYSTADGEFHLLEFHRGKFKPIEDPQMRFDRIYAVPIPENESPHTIIFENQRGYFSLTREYFGQKHSTSKSEQLGLRLLETK